MSNVDPGGGDDGERVDLSDTQSTPNLSTLQESFSQQQTKISALKELVRQSEADQGKSTASAKEKVKNIAQRLNHLKSKTARGRHSEKSFSEIEEEVTVEQHAAVTAKQDDDEDHDESNRSGFSVASVPTTPLPSRARSETPGSEKIQLLRQQMEQNRLKMAERESSKRSVEQLVTQLKSKFESSQLSLEKVHQLGRSVGDLSNLPGTNYVSSKHQSAGDLASGFNLDRERIKFLEKKVRHLETEIKAKEREFFNKDPESEHLKAIKALEEKILDMEENLKEKDELINAKTQAANLISESLSLKGKSTVDMLEDTKQEMFQMQSNFVAVEDDLRTEIDQLTKECQQKDKKIANLEEVNDILETARFDLTVKNSELDNQSSSVEDYIQKVNELNKINEALQRRIERLEHMQIEQDEAVLSSAVAEQARRIEDLEANVNELQKENDELKKSLEDALNLPTTDDEQSKRLQSLELELALKKEECLSNTQALEDVQEQLMEKTVEFNVLVANFNALQDKLKSSKLSKSLFSRPTDEEAHAEIKRLQAQIDTLTSSSDVNKTLIEKQEEINTLNERIVQLESEKVTIMEASKMELQSCFKDNKSKEEVCSQLESIALEEKIEIGLKEAAALQQQIHQLTAEKNDLKTKLDRYMTENIELLNKIEKLSKGSSAESIEIVEGLTAEEKLEMEQLQRQQQRRMTSINETDDADYIPTIPVSAILGDAGRPSSDENSVIIKELNESLDKLSEERMELLRKIELFTAERHEVLEKLNDLKIENGKLLSIIDELRVDKLDAEQTSEILRKEQLDAAKRLREVEDERHDLLENIKEISNIKTRLQEEINLLTQERNAASEGSQTVMLIPNRETYDTGLKNLVTELENFRKTKDKNAKFGISKKIAKEAKLVSDFVPQLLNDYERALDSFTSFRAEVEGIRQAREQFEQTRLELMAEGCSDDLVTYVKTLKERLEVQQKTYREIKNKYEELEQLLEEERNKEKEDLQKSIPEGDKNEIDDSTSSLKDETNRLNEKIRELEEQLNETKEYNFNELQKQRKEFENRLTTSQKEIDILQALVDEQKEQLISAYTEHEDETQEKITQITELGIQVQKLRAELEQTEQRMHSANDSYANELKEKANSMKALLDENQELLQSQAADLANKQETIETLNQQIMDLYAAMEQQGNEIIEKEDEINKLEDTIKEHIREIRTLKDRGQSYEKRIKDAETKLGDKQKEIEEVRVDLETKNKEQLERLKKFAANLKKKNTQYSDLELKYKELEALKENESGDSEGAENKKENMVNQQLLQEQKEEIQRLRIEIQELQVVSKKEAIPLQQSAVADHLQELNVLKDTTANLENMLESKVSVIADLQQRLDHSNAELENLKLRLSEKVFLADQLTSENQSKSSEIIELRDQLTQLSGLKEELAQTDADLKSKNIKIEKCKAIIKEKNKEIKRLGEQVQTLTDQQLPQNELNDQTIDVERLQQEKQTIEQDYESYKMTAEVKLQGNALVIETLENENGHLKERVGRLEESICIAEERRLSLERHSEYLGSQLLQKQSQIEYAEDEYMARMEALVGQDEIIEEKLKDLENDRHNLSEDLKELKEHSNESSRQNSLLQTHITELETKIPELENDKKTLKLTIEKIESQLQTISATLEKERADRDAEYSDLANDYSVNLNQAQNDRRTHQENFERVRDENVVLQNEIDELRDSKAKLEQAHFDLSNQIAWYQEQSANMTQDQLETQELRMQIVQDQTEVENLRIQNQEMARDHEAALNSIRQQLADVQAAYDAIFSTHQQEMMARAQLNAQIDAYQATENALRLELTTIKDQLSVVTVVKDELGGEMDALKTQIVHDQGDLVNLRLQNQQLNTDYESELTALRLRISELNAQQAHSDQEHIVQNLRAQIDNDQTEIENLRSQKLHLENELTALRQQVATFDSIQMHVGQNITQDQLEVQQLRTQVGHDQTEIEILRAQMQQLTSAHDNEMAAIRQQIDQLDSLRMQVGQNQTDDQVFIQNENERLQAVLAEKELEIQNYQRQNLQLQMLAGSSGGAAVAHDPFATFNSNPFAAEGESLDSNRVLELESQLEAALLDSSHRIAQIQDLETQLNVYTTENGKNLHAECLDLQRQCCEKDVEIARLQDIHQQLLSSLPADHDHGALNVGQSFVSARQIHSVSAEPIPTVNFLEITNPTVDSTFQVPPNVEHHDQQIEDLQRNVSDLEKYVTDLEHKLKSSIEDNVKHTNERFILESNFGTKYNQYEEYISTLNQQIDKLKKELALIHAEQQVVQSESEVCIASNKAKTEQSPKTAAIFFASSNETPDDPFNTIVGSDFSAGQYNQADTVDSDGKIPAVEETIVPKKTYLCHPTTDTERQTFSPVQDDAWGETGWGGEAALEEEHQRLSSVEVQSRGLNSAEVKLQLQIDEITIERNNLQTELNSMQTKYGKMLKKLREYKSKNDEYEHSKRASSIETNDLDLAIQEELNAQIQTLEQRIKDMKQEQEKETLEKKKLHSRVDVLTSANDRMTEMKEKQDIEIEVFKTKIRELHHKLEQLNKWGDEEPSSAGHSTNDNASARLTEALNQNRVLEERITRLQESISDKDEFEEERLQLTDKLRQLEVERNLLKETTQQQQNEIDDCLKRISQLENQNCDYSATIDVLTVESNNIKTYLDELKDEHKQKIDENNNLSENLKSLDNRNLELSKQIEEMRQYNLSVQDVEQRIQDLTATVQYKDSQIASLTEQLETDKKEYENKLDKLSRESEVNAATIAELHTQNSKLNAEQSVLEKAIVNTVADATTTDGISTDDNRDAIIAELRMENTNMEQELQALNDQVIHNLEIEDKIKTTVLELDMKNIEISELKSSLEQYRNQQQQSDIPLSSANDQAEQITILQNKLTENENYHQNTIAQLNDQWQQSIEQKCSQLAESWRQHLGNRENEYTSIEQELRQQISQLEERLAQETVTQQQADEAQLTSSIQLDAYASTTTQSIDDSQQPSSEMIEKMQKALEAQEIEIVSLKEQLAMRSAQYARIAAQVDPYGEWSTLANSARPQVDTAHMMDDGAQSRELDHALYMLHQRDMRCEELRMEVINLLEERDALQSKLANSIRQMEHLKQESTSANR